MKKIQVYFVIGILFLFPYSSTAFEVNGVEYGISSYDANGYEVPSYAYVTSRSGGYSGSITIANSVTHEGYTYSVTRIESYAFSGCSNLTSVTIPNSVTTIGEYAFYNCSSLTSVTIPNSVTTIGGGAFRDCSGLTSVTIPNSVTTIGSEAFYGCSGLTSVTIPNSVTTIGVQAFSGCSGLTSVTIPNSVTTIGDRAFGYCSDLKSFVVEELNASYCSKDGVLFDKDIKTLIAYPCKKTGSYTLPETVQIIKDYAFSSSIRLTSVIIPNSVTTIGDRAFYNCSGLTSVTIGNSVTAIGNQTFSGCSGLTSVTIGSSVTTIGDNAFNGCTGLTSVTIPNSVTTIGNSAFYNCSGLTIVTIPNSVTTIENFAFFICTGLTSVTIGSSVTMIGDAAFSGCSGLTSVTIPNSVTTIGVQAFSGCSGLTSVTIPNSVTTIGNSAFYNCSGLTSITIPNSVTTIGSYAFENCSGLTSVTIPNSVTTIGSLAFSGCSGLTSVTIPNSVTTIGYYAFAGCSGLTSVAIPNSVTTIGNGAFYGCRSLGSVIFGTSLDEISNDAFSGTNLTDVTFLGTTPPWIFNNSFSNTENITFHVPEGCKADYLASQELWKSYTVVEGNSEAPKAPNYEYVNAEGNTIGRKLDYDDEENNTLTLADTYQSLTVPQDIPLKQISYERNFGNTSWQTLYVPFEIPVTAELLEEFELAYINAARQYDYDDDGTIDELTIEIFKVKSGTLRANHPYLIRAKETGMKTITVGEATLYATAANQVDCSTTSLSFTFKGAYETLTYDDIYDCRLLGSGKWNTPTSSTTMKPMRFYLRIASRGSEQVLPASSSATPIRMTVWGEDGDATEVDDLQFENGQSSNSKYLDLQGREVEHPESGIYIINGKKVIVK